ncbi:MAG TPA: SCO family protein [Candidatus Krumholzibacteria bacterium]|nr:SCO family protein [Candidatus Krumholzibacteria bacterium]
MPLSRRTALLLVIALGLSASLAARAQVPQPPDEARTRGTHVPDVTLIGEDSTTFALSTLAGRPVIVSPIFTSCRMTCPLITASLRDALAQIGEPGVGYQVLTVSFDPADGPAQLRAYRQEMNLPAGWRLAVATPENLQALLKAIDFNYAPLPEGGFAHANVIAILTPTLEVQGYESGVSFDAATLRNDLEKATRASSLVHHYRNYIWAAAIMAWASVMVILYQTRKKRNAAGAA